MSQQEIINQTIGFVKTELGNSDKAHDWFHIERVWKLAKKIGEGENADMFVVEMSALLHDVADWKLPDKDERLKRTKNFLTQTGLNQKTIDKVIDITQNLSFKGAGVKDKLETLEGKIVQDADRLDGIGAIGVARTFAYGGHIRESLHDPEIKPVLHKTERDYESKETTMINHFYEKLLLLKDRMNTKTAKQIAERRHRFMEDFLKQFFKEWEVEA